MGMRDDVLQECFFLSHDVLQLPFIQVKKKKKKMSIRNDNNRKEEPLTHLKLVQALLKEGCRKIPLKIHEMPSSTLQRASPIEAYAKNWPTRNS